ncbi:hypothetical protein G6F61_003669 [Rhizopus arrhizus]|nr:hypothetical protein G6F61_003669 [Rhizopus arrhizus]
MGNVTSQDKSKEIKKDYLSRRKYTFKKPQQSSQQASPNSILLETSSNASVSKNMSDISPNPAIEDMKLCAQRILSKSSSVSEISAQYAKSNAIKDERSTLSLESRRKIVQRFNYKCCLPIEETMADYLLNAHFVIKHLFGGNFSAPVHEILSNSISVAKDTVFINSNPLEPITPPCDDPFSFSIGLKQDTVARGLDIVCGTGTWAMEMASTYPESHFYGIGYDAIYPTSIKPQNVHFSTRDILDSSGFPFKDEHFDYIHMRFVWCYFSKADAKFVMSEVNRVLKPGGYVEMRDCDPIMKNTGPIGTNLYKNLGEHIYNSHDIDATWTQHLPELLSHQAGLTDIHHQMMPITFERSTPMANCINNFLSDSIKSYKPLFMESCGFSPEECDVVIQKAIDEAHHKHSYFNFYICWGRKPLVADQLVTTPLARHDSHSVLSTSSSYWTCKDNSDAFPLTPCQSPGELPETVTMSDSVDDICQFANGFIE